MLIPDGGISFDTDTVYRSLATLISLLDDLPEASTVAEQSGPRHGVAAVYGDRLEWATSKLAATTSAMRETLLGMDADIRAYVAAMEAHEQLSETQGDILTDRLDDATVAVAAASENDSALAEGASAGDSNEQSSW